MCVIMTVLMVYLVGLKHVEQRKLLVENNNYCRVHYYLCLCKLHTIIINYVIYVHCACIENSNRLHCNLSDEY